MLVDHIGLLFYPEYIGFRILGRLAMPLFAYGIANGYYHVQDKIDRLNAYKQRLLVMGVISQPFFLLIQGEKMHVFPLNICITWYIAVFALQIASQSRLKTVRWSIPALLKKNLPSAFLVALACILKVEYGLYAVFVVIIIFFYRIRKRQQVREFVATILVTLLYAAFNWQSAVMQIFALAAFPLLDVVTLWDNKVKLPKYFFYVFYPCHMLILWVIKNSS